MQEIPKSSCKAPLLMACLSVSHRNTCLTVAIVVGLLVMMWPILTKVQYERLPKILRTKHIWRQIGISIILNWVIAPFVSASSYLAD